MSTESNIGKALIERKLKYKRKFKAQAQLKKMNLLAVPVKQT